jgi:hypothetical protein
MLICTPYITLRNGQRLYASQKGKEAFCFEVTEEQHQKYKNKKMQNTVENQDKKEN